MHDMSKLTQQDLITAVAAQTGLTKTQTGDAIRAAFTEITSQVASGHVVSVYGFGTFESVATAERQGHNPATMAPVHVPASKRVKFTVSSTLKRAVKG